LPTLILQHDAYGCWFIVLILIFFAVTLTACYAAVPMLILQMLPSLPVFCLSLFSLAIAVTAHYALPILIPQDDAVGSQLIVAIICIFLLSLSLLVATLCQC